MGMHPLSLPQNPLPQEQVPVAGNAVAECSQQADAGANASLDSDDTVLLDDCQTATNDFAKQNGIPCSSGMFKEHTFLVEIRRLDNYYAKCLLCPKEFDIEIESKNNIFLGTYVHMSCVLYDGKIHVLRYVDEVKKFQETHIQLRKILMSPNMIKSEYQQQWDPANISGCMIKPMKKCRLVELPRYQ